MHADAPFPHADRFVLSVILAVGVSGVRTPGPGTAAAALASRGGGRG